MLCFQGNENHHRHCGGAGQQVGMVNGTEAEGSRLKPQSRTQKKKTGNGDFEPQHPPAVTYSSIKTKPPRPTQTKPPTEDQVFRHVSVWGTFSSKPPHSPHLSWPSVSHWAPPALLISWPTFQSSSHCTDQSFSCPVDPYFFACPLNTVFPMYVSAVCRHDDAF